MCSDSPSSVSVEEITHIVASFMGVSVESMVSRTRKREVCEARHISLFLSERYVKASLGCISKFFGGRDHTTAIHSRYAVLDLIDTDQSVKLLIEVIVDKIELTYNCKPLPVLRNQIRPKKIRQTKVLL